MTEINVINNNNPDKPENNLNPVSTLEVFKWFVAKEKALYFALNNMRLIQQTYTGFFWAPTELEMTIRETLRAHPTCDFKRYDHHNIKPPTYIKLNEFTYAF